MRHSVTLRAKIALAGGAAPEPFAHFWASPELGRLFPEFLMLLHQIVRATVPLMTRGLEVSRTRAIRDQDAVCGRLATYLATHIEEERAHDEWLLEDLEACGWSRASVWARTPTASVAALVGAQYYWVLHGHPSALLGYIAVLEGAPPTTEHIDRVRQATKLPEAMFRTYRKHAELDPGHQSHFDRFLDDLPLDADHSGLIGLSAIHTVQTLGHAMSALLHGDGE